MAVFRPLFLLSFMFTYSNAAVCVCKDASDQELQKVIDFACGGGADCTQIQTTGACYQPNTVKNHCDVAVNSYYQKKASTGATCDFNGAAVISTSTTSNCLSSSSSNGIPTTGSPTAGNLTAGTPTTAYPSTGTPTANRPTSSSSTTFPGTTMGPSSSTSGFGLGDPSGVEELSVRTTMLVLLTTIVTAVVFRV